MEGCCVILKLRHISFTPMQTLASYTQSRYVHTCPILKHQFICTLFIVLCQSNQWCAQEFCSGAGGGGFQQIQLRTEDRENGDLGSVAPYSGVLEAAVIWYKEFHFT